MCAPYRVWCIQGTDQSQTWLDSLGRRVDTDTVEVQKKVHLPVPVETGKDAQGEGSRTQG